jgi:CBS domain-containing protein
MERIFPKTVILSITTHGEILLNNPVTNPSEIIYTNGIPMNIPTFNVDTRIKEFYKFNAVAPGVINYVEGDGEIDVYDIERAHNLEDLFNESGNVTKINSGIRQFIVNNNIEKKRLMDSAEDVAEIVREVATNIVSEKKQDEKTMKKELKGVTDPEKLEELIDIMEYLNTHDKSHLLVDSNSKGGYMVNKTYLLGKNDVSPSGGEDWSISCLNFPFLHSDIFNNILIWKNSRLTKPNKIPIKGADRGSVTLKDITDYLAEQGVTRLIIVDLTCSPFAVADQYYSGRIARRFRNDILGTKTPYGGGSPDGENIKYICYTGIGSRKNGNHSRKQYLNVMNKHFKKDCSKYFKSLKCKSCKKYKEMGSKTAKKFINAHLAKKTYKMSKKTEEKLVKQMEKCNSCKNKKTRKCDFKKYIEFSGANLGKCKDIV